MRAAALGAAILAGGLAVAGLIAWTGLGVTAVIAAGFAAMFAVIGGAGFLGLALAVREDRRAARQAQPGDDTPKPPIDAEIEQMIINYGKGGRGA